MQELRELFESLGFEDVRTLIQSGNVIFRSASPPSTDTLEAAISERFHVAAPVVLRTPVQLAEIIEHDPFGDADRAHLHVGFMVEAISAAAMDALDLARFAPERVAASGTELYFCLPAGMGNSKLASYVARKVTGVMTVRNWNTVATLAELAATVPPRS
jgi:uncharacterized protein (DUF1697 family)